MEKKLFLFTFFFFFLKKSQINDKKIKSILEHLFNHKHIVFFFVPVAESQLHTIDEYKNNNCPVKQYSVSKYIWPYG